MLNALTKCNFNNNQTVFSITFQLQVSEFTMTYAKNLLGVDLIQQTKQAN